MTTGLLVPHSFTLYVFTELPTRSPAQKGHAGSWALSTGPSGWVSEEEPAGGGEPEGEAHHVKVTHRRLWVASPVPTSPRLALDWPASLPGGVVAAFMGTARAHGRRTVAAC